MRGEVSARLMVSRMWLLVNIAYEMKRPELAAALAGVYGELGTTKGTVTTWLLPAGITATLDIGAATARVVVDGVTSAHAAHLVMAPASAKLAMAEAPTRAGTDSPAESLGMAACCAAMESALQMTVPDQSNAYFTLLNGCRVHSPAAAPARKQHLRQNGAGLNVGSLP